MHFRSFKAHLLFNDFYDKYKLFLRRFAITRSTLTRRRRRHRGGSTRRRRTRTKARRQRARTTSPNLIIRRTRRPLKTNSRRRKHSSKAKRQTGTTGSRSRRSLMNRTKFRNNNLRTNLVRNGRYTKSANGRTTSSGTRTLITNGISTRNFNDSLIVASNFRNATVNKISRRRGSNSTSTKRRGKRRNFRVRNHTTRQGIRTNGTNGTMRGIKTINRQTGTLMGRNNASSLNGTRYDGNGVITLRLRRQRTSRRNRRHYSGANRSRTRRGARRRTRTTREFKRRFQSKRTSTTIYVTLVSKLLQDNKGNRSNMNMNARRRGT